MLSWLVIGRPTRTLCGSVTDTVSSDVQAVPSGEYDAVMLLPLRTSFTHFGAPPATAKFVVVPPDVLRHCNAMPLPGVTNTDAWGEEGSAVARIMTPVFTHAFRFCTVATRATIVPSPFIG